jgi:hypothetical protein
LEHYAKSKELHDNILSIVISKFSFSYRSIRNSGFYVIIIAMRNIPSMNANMISCCLTVRVAVHETINLVTAFERLLRPLVGPDGTKWKGCPCCHSLPSAR